MNITQRVAGQPETNLKGPCEAELNCHVVFATHDFQVGDLWHVCRASYGRLVVLGCTRLETTGMGSQNRQQNTDGQWQDAVGIIKQAENDYFH